LREIETRDRQNLVLNLSEDKDHAGKFKINIEAPFRISNSLPKEIYVQMLNHHKETSFTKKLMPNETIEDYGHTHTKRTYLRVMV